MKRATKDTERTTGRINCGEKSCTKPKDPAPSSFQTEDPMTETALLEVARLLIEGMLMVRKQATDSEAVFVMTPLTGGKTNPDAESPRNPK